jgi:TIR domain
VAVKQWLIEHEPGLVDEIYLDVDPHTGIRPGERWKGALNKATARCEAVICLLSKHWLNSPECLVEFRYAENLHKAILCARLEPVSDDNITSEWQRCDLFPDHGPTTEVDIADGGDPLVFDSAGLQRLLNGLRALGIGAEHFRWPPPSDPDRAPYRGWAPLEEADAAVFFGRDAQILRGLDVVRGMRTSGVESLFVILGPSGAGKSSFLRAGLLPRLRQDDRQFLPLSIVRPERAVLTGELGSRPPSISCGRIWACARRCWVRSRTPATPSAWSACGAGWRRVATPLAPGCWMCQPSSLRRRWCCRWIRPRNCSMPTPDPRPRRFLELLASLVQHEAGVTSPMIVAVTIPRRPLRAAANRPAAGRSEDSRLRRPQTAAARRVRRRDHRPGSAGQRGVGCGVQPRRAPASPPPALTARCGCGTPTPANPSAIRSPATPTR